MSRFRISPASISLALALLLAPAIPLASQARAGGERTLEARMDDFLVAFWKLDVDSIAAFFPRRGEWSWVVTVHRDGEPDRVGIWRFAASETIRAISPGGPVCESFDPPSDTWIPGSLTTLALSDTPGWRRVRGNRFVPRGAPPRSPAFVEWRREDGEWVVSAFGDERERGRRVLGVPIRTVVRDGPRTLPVPKERTYGAGAEWFEKRLPLHYGGMYFLMYGLPRELAESDVVRFGSVGRVAIYVEAGAEGSGVFYVAVRPGLYQPYNGFGSPDCLRGG